MFEQIFNQVEQAKTSLNQSLSSFERESTKARESLEKEIEDFREKLKTCSAISNKEFDIAFDDLVKRINVLMEAKSLEFEEKVKHLEFYIEQKTAGFYDQVKIGLEKIYTDLERAAKEKPLKDFEISIEQVFEKNQERLTPLILKSLTKHIFSFGKSNKK